MTRPTHTPPPGHPRCSPSLDSKGAKDGKIYDLKGWLKRLFA
ncbi:hypothetical protein BH11MYX1_BH11MYX1_20920 [soil metagenome]